MSFLLFQISIESFVFKQHCQSVVNPNLLPLSTTFEL